MKPKSQAEETLTLTLSERPSPTPAEDERAGGCSACSSAGPSFSSPAIAVLLERFEAELRRTRATDSTVRAYVADVRCLFSPPRPATLEEMTPKKIRRYLARFAATSKARKLAAIRRFGAVLVSDADVPQELAERFDSFDLARPPWREIAKRAPSKVLKESDVARIAEAATNDRNRALVELLGIVGMKPSEATRLRGEDVTFDENGIAIAAAVEPFHRYVVGRWMLSYQTLSLLGAAGREEPILANRYGDEVSTRGARKIVAEVSARAGTPATASDLRASVLARQVELGATAKKAAASVGLVVAPRWLIARERAIRAKGDVT